jgi:hypothetical protein
LTALFFENDKSVTTEIQQKCLLGEGNQPAVILSFSFALAMMNLLHNENFMFKLFQFYGSLSRRR